MGAADVVPKDVVIAALGAASALAGFVLVFLALLVTSLSSFRGEAIPLVRKRFVPTVALAIGAFVFSLATVASGVAWLAYSQSRTGYNLLLWLFFVQLGLVFVLGVVATIQALG